MARREIGEINAGSMADIAFLLLIFFLVTTTIEVDAGIGRQLPLKLDTPPPEHQEINERNILKIFANSNDELLVEDKRIEIEELEEIAIDFYTANRVAEDQDLNMPNYFTIDIPTCQAKIVEIEGLLEENEDKFLEKELSKWKTKLSLCESLPGNQYREIHKSALVQLKNQGNTSYGLYIEIQNILKKVVNDLRVEKAQELWEVDYFELDDKESADQEKIEMLRVLVPERIIEAKIDR